MRAFVIDTNVAVVANGRGTDAGLACVKACILELQRIRQEGKVVLDTGMLILNQYKRNLRLKGQPGVGDAFFKWLWAHQGMPERCERVTITPVNGSFREFPNDSQLEGFHRKDRMFVAVALACTCNPEVLNAVDSHWWDFRQALQRHGLRIRFLCPEKFQGRPGRPAVE